MQTTHNTARSFAPGLGRAAPLPAFPPEVLARLAQALHSRPVEDLPSACARPLYELLRAHGLDRSDLLGLAASLVDLVAMDATLGPTESG